jgi:hypothetical protein
MATDSPRFRGDLEAAALIASECPTLLAVEDWARAAGLCLVMRPRVLLAEGYRGWIVEAGSVRAEHPHLDDAVADAAASWTRIRRADAERAVAGGHSAECPITHCDTCERCGWDAVERGAA